MASSLRSRPWAAGAAILGFAMTTIYLVVILAEGDDSFSEIFPWALLMATGAVLAFASTQVANLRVARGLLLGAAAIFGVIGLLAILSIGLGFLLAAVAAVVAAVRTSNRSALGEDGGPPGFQV